LCQIIHMCSLVVLGSGAAISPNRRYATSDALIATVEKFFAGEPVPVISTDDAVDAAHETGKDDD
jgi:hypothetical protein